MKQKQDEYNHKQWQEKQQTLKDLEDTSRWRPPIEELPNKALIPLKRNPPPTKLMNSQEIQKEVLEREKEAIELIKGGFEKEIRQALKNISLDISENNINIWTTEYNKLEKTYKRFLDIKPKNKIDKKNKKIKKLQYQNKLNQILNKLFYNKYFFNLVERIEIPNNKFSPRN